MNITIIAEVLGKANNGTTISALTLINYLKSRGHNVKVVCCDYDKLGKEGYYVVPHTNMGFIINYMLEKNDVVLAKFDKSIEYEAIKDADVVHIMIPLFIARKSAKLVKKLGIPLTAGFHAQAENFSSHLLLMNSKAFNHWTYKWYYNKLYKYADAIHYPTKFIKELFEKEVNKKTNAYVISNGVNKIYKKEIVEKDDKYKDKFSILFIGRFAKEKSHKILLKAVKESKHEKDIQLFFAGEGPTKEKVIKYSKKNLTNQPVINFYTRKDLVRLINQCDLYCHPAEVEIEAIACLEAISCGLVPLINNSPKSATCFFSLDDRCLFDYNNHHDLSKKIDYFYENRDKLVELQEKYLEYASKFDQEKCMEQMEKMFLDIIENNRKKNNESN